MNNKVFNVLIVGAGQIGSGFDYPESKLVLTHANAFTKHNGFNIIGFVDSNKLAAEKAAKKWSVLSFSSIEEAFNSSEIDVVTVATPDKSHFEILKNISFYKPLFVLAEKPLTKTIQEAYEIQSIFNSKNIPLIVNYKRRFTPEFIELKEKLDDNVFGDFIFGTSFYGKGLIHNGSHLIDLIQFLFEIEWKKIEILDKVIDFEKDDPSYTFILSDANKSILIKALDSSNFTAFEMDLIFKKGRVRIIKLGSEIEIYSAEKNDIFPTHMTLKKVEILKTKLNSSLLYTVNHIYDHLTNGCELVCSLSETVKLMEFINKIKNKS